MADTQITRCPHCQTTFRIRTEQLAAAKGAVRCGSCLQVFIAVEHLVSEKPQVAAEKPQVAAEKPQVSAEKSQEPGKPKETEATSNAPHPSPTSDPAITAKKSLSFDDIPDQINDDPLEDLGIREPERYQDETFESELQLDDSIFSMQESAKPSRYSLHEHDNDINFNLTDEFKSDHFGSDNLDSNPNHDEAWASSLLDDDNPESKKNITNDESWADDLLDEDLLDDIDMNFSQDNVRQEDDDFVAPLDDDPKDEQFHLGGNQDLEQEEIELNLTDSVNDLYDEPISLNSKNKKAAKKEQRTSFIGFWLSASVLMVLLMISQIGYFKFDSWSRHPDFRPAYTIVCDLMDCQLPAIQDVKQMNTQHFMVRLHPEIEQALYIDTLLINNASYQQPFPDLRLVFTGLENQVIASRRFKPKEYLAGELAGATVMPQKVPIHISFEVLNPGAEAVSYRIELAANH